MMRTMIFTAAAFAAALPAIAAEEHRQAGAHEHGHGTLDVAIEGKRVSMTLAVPGADIVGFEHEATTQEQKEKVAKAKKILADALAVFAFPAAAGCKLTEAKIEVGAEEHEHKDEHKKDAGGKAEEEHHSEFHAEYALSCDVPEKLTGIEFKYFELFPDAEELDVNVASENGQTKYEVTREKPSLKLGEVG
jgi:hypothetical protein